MFLTIMINPIKTFGKTPRSMMAFVGKKKKKTVHGEDYDSETFVNDDLGHSCSQHIFCNKILEAYQFLSQPMQESDFVKPHPINGFAKGTYSCKCGKCQELFMGDKRAVTCSKCSGFDDYHLFKGEWKVESYPQWFKSSRLIFKDGKRIGEIHAFKTRNDFIKYCEDNGIELEFNELWNG